MTKLAGLVLLWTTAYTLGAARSNTVTNYEVDQLRAAVVAAEGYRLQVGARLRTLETDMTTMPMCSYD